MKSLTATGENIFVEVLKEFEKKTASGLIIPETVKDEPQCYGKVINAGPDCKISVVKGDVILFAKFGGQTVLMNEGKEYRVLKSGEVYGILSEE